MPERADVPPEWINRVEQILAALPECRMEDAWTGVRWRLGQATVAHLFGGEDQLVRITFRAEPDEVMAFEHLGPPYFKASWGGNVVGLLVSDDTDWEEVAELLTDSYCVQAPKRLAELVQRPESR